MSGARDPVEDIELIDYLFLGIEPVVADSHDRICDLAKVYRA